MWSAFTPQRGIGVRHWIENVMALQNSVPRPYGNVVVRLDGD